MSADKNLYRVWPDGWVQDASEEPPTWRSDDFVILAAEDEDAALAEFERRDAENAALQQGYDAARLEIEALRSRQCLHGISDPSGWMPIETAPKDGTAIDLWRVGGGREPCAVWGLPPHCCGEMGRLCDSDWHDYQQGWVTDWFDEPEPDSEFTHWMHLPPQPTTSAGSGKGE